MTLRFKLACALGPTLGPAYAGSLSALVIMSQKLMTAAPYGSTISGLRLTTAV